MYMYIIYLVYNFYSAQLYVYVSYSMLISVHVLQCKTVKQWIMALKKEDM